MKSKKKTAGRIISMFLAAAMVLTSLPQSVMSVYAAETAGVAESLAQSGSLPDAALSDDAASFDTENEAVGKEENDGAQTAIGTAGDSGLNDDALSGEAADGTDKTAADGSEADGVDNAATDGSEADGSDKATDGSETDDAGKLEDADPDDDTSLDGEKPEEDGLQEGEPEQNEVSVDDEIGEAEPVVNDTEETVFLSFVGSDSSMDGLFEVLDGSSGEPLDMPISIPKGSTENVKFKVMPKSADNVITNIDINKSKLGARFVSRKEVGGGYECEIAPRNREGFKEDIIITIINVMPKKSNNITFAYSADIVGELVVTNGDEKHILESNGTIQAANEYSVSLKLKMKDAEAAPIVKKKAVADDDPDNITDCTPDEKDEEGYYCYSMGKILEDTVITIEDGYIVRFEYNAESEIIFGISRYEISGDEEDYGLEGSEVSFDPMYDIDTEAYVAKGDPLYFNFDLANDNLAGISVVDDDGNPCKEFVDGEGWRECYKVAPQRNMSVYITAVPTEIPVNYEESAVKNISVSSGESDSITYDPDNKKIVGIYYYETGYNISFELEEGKEFKKVVAVHYSEWEDQDKWYEDINVSQDADGVYTGTGNIGYDVIEIRIIAGEDHTITFEEIPDNVRVCHGDDYDDIAKGSTAVVTDGDEYVLRIYMKDGYGLATPSVTATSGGETGKLEVKRIDYDGEVSYRVSIVPKTDMSISISTVSKTIPFTYTEGTIKDITLECGSGSAALADDKKNININSYSDLAECKITFAPETGKTVTRAYYDYKVPVYDEDEYTQIGTKSYTKNIPLSYNESANTYTINGISAPNEEEGWYYLDFGSIYIAAGDTSKLTFDVPENKASVYSFNDYNHNSTEAVTSPVNAAQNQEYLFRVVLPDSCNIASYSVTAGNAELAERKYNIADEWDEPEYISYYAYTPVSANETIRISVTPRSVPVKYEADSIDSISLKESSVVNKPEFANNNLILWGNALDAEFTLNLKNGKKLSRIFGSYTNEKGVKSEKEIVYSLNDVSGSYEFAVSKEDLGVFSEIEIITGKVNLSDCTPKLMLDGSEMSRSQDESNEYYTAYMAKEIEPTVVLTYKEGETAEPEQAIASTEYEVSYENNRNAGMAKVIVTAKEGSGCTGSCIIEFRIDTAAAAPTIAKYNVYTEAGVSGEDVSEKNKRTLNLSNRFKVSTQLNEEGVEPISYTYVSNTPGGVLDTGVTPEVEPVYEIYYTPWGGEEQELLYYQLNFSVADTAAAESEAAAIVLRADFENYESAEVTIEVSVKEKTPLKLGLERPSYKLYDGKAYSLYDVDKIYVVDDAGQKRTDSDAIMAEIKDDIRLRYKGDITFGKNKVPYDSYEAPVKPGSYQIIVEISEANDKYKLAADVQSDIFNILRRSITIKADAVNINVGDAIPDKYEYTVTYEEGDGFMDGDVISPESVPVLSCYIMNTDTAGRYEIRVYVDEIDIVNSDGESVIGYYNIETKNAWLTVSEREVVKKTVTLSQTNASIEKTYDKTGFNGKALINVKDGAADVTDAKLSIRYVGRGDTTYPISSTAPVNAGTYTLKAKVDASDDKYTSDDELSINIEIKKAAAPAFTEKVINTQSVEADTPKTLDITQYVPAEYGNVTYGPVTKSDTSNILTGTEQIDSDGTLTYTLKAGAVSGTATLTIPLVFRNYENADLTIKIALTSKTLLTLLKAPGAVGKEYDGTAYVLPESVITASGIPDGETAVPKYKYVYTQKGSEAPISAVNAGTYSVTVTVADDDENYAANEPLVIGFEITRKAVNVTAGSGTWNSAMEIPSASSYPFEYEADKLIGSDLWVNGPTSYRYTYSLEGKETVLTDNDEVWNALEAGTVITVTPSGASAGDNYTVTHIPGRITVAERPNDGEMYVPDIASMTYTGSQLKPQVKAYVMKNGEYTELTSKDYKVTYGENKNAGKGTVKITGKGNYRSEITKEFTIEKASIGNGSENKDLGITLKYTEQSLNTKEVKLVTSLKYKKALKEGTDFTVTLAKDGAPEGTAAASKTEGTTPAKTPKGEANTGTYTLRIAANDNTNYSGYIEKKVYIAGKDNLLKNAKITIKKKSLKWDDKDTANYGNYDKDNWGGFYLAAGSAKNDKDFTVSIKNTYLTNKQTSAGMQDADSQYYISYTNNNRAGTATITVTGDGKTYFGTKSATFKIQGTAFKAGTKNGNIKLPETLTAAESYTGKDIEKTVDTLEIVGKTEKLTKDKDYSVTYGKNRRNKGSVTVTITANPESGYTGSIKKNFKITPADLKKAIQGASDGINAENVVIKPETGGAASDITGIDYKGPAPYSKTGATITSLIFTNREGIKLKSGTDYTVKYTYADKKDKKAGSTATMTLKGKGNYSGTLDVSFTIGKAEYSNLDVSVASVKAGNKALKPKVTVKDGKKALKVSEDGSKEVKITYANNEPDKVNEWLKWLSSGATQDTAPAAPTVTVELMDSAKANYEQAAPETLTLNVYSGKLDKNKLAINWSDMDAEKKVNAVYDDGRPVNPVITSISYDSKTYTVKTSGGACYAYDTNNVEIFKITYGANNKTGKKAGSVTIEGLRLYGGKYTEKFEIKAKAINQ